MKQMITSIFLCFILVNALAVDLELTTGTNQRIPVAVVPFKNPGVFDVSKQINDDLILSGRFRLITNANESEQPHNALAANFPYWKKLGANFMLVGDIKHEANNKVSVAFQLLDPVTTAHILISREFTVDASELKALAHHISNIVYQQITGDKGIFTSRLAYVLVKNGPNTSGRYELLVADYNGDNPKPLLISSEPLMSPAWSPDAKHLAFVSFENKRSEIYLVDVQTGRRQLISKAPGINGAPTWSPDGRSLVFVLSKTGAPKLYRYQLASKKLEQLTYGLSIDTEPEFSKDGRSLLFTSNRGGGPQIYQLSLANKKISRLTFAGNYNSSAKYLGNSKEIVLLHRDGKKYQISRYDLVDDRFTPLSFSTLDESPSSSPNGELVVYATELNQKGVLSVATKEGVLRYRIKSVEGQLQEPDWSPALG